MKNTDIFRMMAGAGFITALATGAYGLPESQQIAASVAACLAYGVGYAMGRDHGERDAQEKNE